MSLMAANEESDPSAILNGFWVTLSLSVYRQTVIRPIYILSEISHPEYKGLFPSHP